MQSSHVCCQGFIRVFHGYISFSESENQNLRSMHTTMQENLASAREEAQEKMRLYLDVLGQKKIADQNLTKINAKYDQYVG